MEETERRRRQKDARVQGGDGLRAAQARG